MRYFIVVNECLPSALTDVAVAADTAGARLCWRDCRSGNARYGSRRAGVIVVVCDISSLSSFTFCTAPFCYILAHPSPPRRRAGSAPGCSWSRFVHFRITLMHTVSPLNVCHCAIVRIYMPNVASRGRIACRLGRPGSRQHARWSRCNGQTCSADVL